MRQRIQKEVTHAKTLTLISGNNNKMENPLAEEAQNIDNFCEELKRIIFLKNTRENLTKHSKSHNQVILTADLL